MFMCTFHEFILSFYSININPELMLAQCVPVIANFDME